MDQHTNTNISSIVFGLVKLKSKRDLKTSISIKIKTFQPTPQIPPPQLQPQLQPPPQLTPIIIKSPQPTPQPLPTVQSKIVNPKTIFEVIKVKGPNFGNNNSTLASLPKSTVRNSSSLFRVPPTAKIRSIKQLDNWLGLNREEDPNVLIRTNVEPEKLPSKTELKALTPISVIYNDLNGGSEYVKDDTVKTSITKSKPITKNRPVVKIIIVPVITQQWTITQIVQNRCPKGWRDLFVKCYDEFPYIDKVLNEHKMKGNSIFPLMKDIFSVYSLCKPEDVRVVIIGQDPYHTIDLEGLPVANGISFSTRRGVPIPRSLSNIYKELCKEIPGYRYPAHADLTKWVRQGVFMLNTCLTVNKSSAGSHKTLWRNFTKETLVHLSSKNKNIIFMLWGKVAGNFVRKYVRNSGIFLETSHPSPFSANRGFFGCGHFRRTNEILIERNETPIDWSIT